MGIQTDSLESSQKYNALLQKVVQDVKRKQIQSRIWISLRLAFIGLIFILPTLLIDSSILQNLFLNLSATFLAAAILFYFLDDIWRRSHENYNTVLETMNYVSRLKHLFDQTEEKVSHVKAKHKELQELLNLVPSQKYTYQVATLNRVNAEAGTLNSELGGLNSKISECLKSLSSIIDEAPSPNIELMNIFNASYKRLAEVNSILSHTIDDITAIFVSVQEHMIDANTDYLATIQNVNTNEAVALRELIEQQFQYLESFRASSKKLEQMRDQQEEELRQLFYDT